MTWEIIETDLAEQDRDKAVLFVLGLRQADYATRWHRGLTAAIAALKDFPGPRAFPRVESEEEVRRQETRVMLYRGPDKRPADSVTYRVLFTLFDPIQGEEVGAIFIQRIRHAQRGDAQEQDFNA